MSLRTRVVALLLCGLAAAPVQAAETVEYIHTDALGSPVAITDANRVVIERSEYEPYGALVNRPLTDGPGYTGHVTDAATGLTYMQQRYYDPVIGRFLSVDPVSVDGSTGENFNRYGYANNNPYTFTDPDGRTAQIAIPLVVAGAICAKNSACRTAVKAAAATAAAYIGSKLLTQPEVPSDDSDVAPPEPGTAESDEGCIYCVDGSNTESGKDYIGSADDLDKRTETARDGRDRSNATKVDSYKKGDRVDRQNKEQNAMNARGGKENLDNKRNEVAPRRWEERGIKPPNQ